MSPQLELSTFLDAIRRRWRVLTALRAGSVAIAGLAVALGLFALLARAAQPTADVLVVIAAAALVSGAAWVARIVRRVGVPDDRRLARFIEERRPEFEDGLVTAVEVRHRPQTFGAAILADAALRARGVEPSAIVGKAELKHAAGRTAAACALLLVAGGASMGPFGQALDAARVRLFPSRISILVEPGNARIVAGRPFTIRARVAGVPRGFDAHPTIAITSGSSSRRQAMTAAGDRFELRMNAVSTSFSYEVSAAGVRSPGFKVTVLQRPALQQIDVAYDYPAYTGMPPRTEEDGGDIYAPAGTRVTLRVHGSKQLRGGTLRLGGASIPLQPGREPRVQQTSFTVTRDGSYRVDLTDADGLASDPSSEYFVRVTDDRPPEVRIVRPETDRQVTALEEVEIDAQAEDDYQVGSLELVYAVGAQPERVVPLSRAAGPSISGRHLLALEDLHVTPGDMVRAFARAREARPGGREIRSEMLLLEVAPFDQQFAFAQSQAGGGGGGEVESLIQAEKNILNGTWNLLRRSSAGRSDADVKALSGAQVELKQRAEAAAGGPQPGRREAGRAAPVKDPMSLAAAAMGRAAESLHRARLQDAVPQEMEALTQLGRALAENKRREVTEQRGSGGGGGGAASQDLSTLFDRELLRQQQTNYENRNNPSTEDTRDRESDLQKRVRELAKRQDDLAREQRQLAQQQVSEQERRRQLERLTREQEELRQQAEQLARDLQRQQGRGQSEQSQSLREAADEMRASSGDMRRDDAQSASQRGSRAADRLRKAQQPATGDGSSQPQSIGELQMEAQQLSDAQRRMEEQRPGHTGRAGQAADEQDRLAQRAQRLRDAARALASGRGDQKQRQAAASAARELERERVAERMHEQAERMRGAGEPAQASKNESQAKDGPRGSRLSSTLDRVAQELGQGADADTRKVAEEMARNRSAREQLEETARRLERAQREGNTGAQGELREEMQRAEQMLRDLQQRGDRPESGMGRTTPEQHEWSRSAPGLESFKQDFTRWEQLKRDITLALERRDLTLAQQLKGRDADDGVKAGSVEGLPEAYRARVSKYFEALARAGRKNPGGQP